MATKLTSAQLARARNGGGSPSSNAPSYPASTSSGGSSDFNLADALKQAAARGGTDPSDFSLWSNRNGKPKSVLASEEAKRIYNMNPTELVALQERLLRAGFYGSGTTTKEINWGAADPSTAQAYQAAIQSAGSYYDAGATLSIDEMLDNFASTRDKNGLNASLTSGKTPLTIQLDDPQQLQDGLSQVAQGMIGRKVTGEELGNGFVQWYNAKQVAAQQAAYNTDDGGTITAPMDAQTAAQQYVKKKLPNEVAAHDIANTGQEFFDLLKGIAG